MRKLILILIVALTLQVVPVYATFASDVTEPTAEAITEPESTTSANKESETYTLESADDWESETTGLSETTQETPVSRETEENPETTTGSETVSTETTAPETSEITEETAEPDTSEETTVPESSTEETVTTDTSTTESSSSTETTSASETKAETESTTDSKETESSEETTSEEKETETSASETEKQASDNKKKNDVDDDKDSKKEEYDLQTPVESAKDVTSQKPDQSILNRLSDIINNEEFSLTATQTKIIDAASKMPAAPAGYCASWVSNVFAQVGVSIGGDANGMWANYCYTSDFAKLLPGMIIAVQHAGTNQSSWGYLYGHVGIYIGDGKVIDSHSEVISSSSSGTVVAGVVSVVSLEYWLTKYDTYSTARFGYPEPLKSAVNQEMIPTVPTVNIEVISTPKGISPFKVLITWKPDAYATHYCIYKNGKLETVQPQKYPFYIDTKVTAGMEYYYQVVASNFDENWNLIAQSDSSLLIPECFAFIPEREEILTSTDVVLNESENNEVFESNSSASLYALKEELLKNNSNMIILPQVPLVVTLENETKSESNNVLPVDIPIVILPEEPSSKK